jgi:dTDP-4-dehydrorhamnose reductase
MEGKKVLILGVTGMLGHTLFNKMNLDPGFDVWATARDFEGLEKWFSPQFLKRIVTGVEVDNFASVITAIKKVNPEVVINCIGIIKQLPSAKDPITAISINSLLPHQLAKICGEVDARLIHISTDCVFDGAKGSYTENDQSNATDLYGRTKFLGEVDYPHAITLRTSIIGHELKGKLSLIDWFLAQEEKVRGFTKAIYTGFPTIEFTRIISEYVIPYPELHGLYQVSAAPISKYDLLKLVARRYNKEIDIEPYDDFRLDRSLDSTLFRSVTGYVPPSWEELVDKMYQDYVTSVHYRQSLWGRK